MTRCHSAAAIPVFQVIKETIMARTTLLRRLLFAACLFPVSVFASPPHIQQPALRASDQTMSPFERFAARDRIERGSPERLKWLSPTAAPHAVTHLRARSSSS
jgi:hypothetical protein